MRKMKNRISPVVMAVILGALLYLPMLGSMSLETAKLAIQNKIIYTKMTLESNRVDVKH